MHFCRKHLFFVLLASAVATAGCDIDSPDVTGQGQARLLVAKPGADLVPDSFIVVLHQDPARRAASPERLAESTMLASGLRPDRVTRSFGHALTGFVAKMSRAEAEVLLANPNVKYIEQNQYVRVNETWGLDRTDQRFLPLDNANFAGAGDYAGDGAGSHVYIIDTGVRLTHSEFAGRIGDGYDAVDDDDDPSDCHGHGTHVAGTVAGTTYGLAKGATVHGVRVLNCSGSGTYEGVIAGIDWVTANHQSPAVANMSLGGGYSQAVNDAVTASVQAGVVHAVAAGNDYGGNACTRSPAGTPDALTIGSTTNTDARSSFSNIGTCVDLFAPGSNITSAWHSDDTAINTISGTSMATPHVAGAAALYRANNPGADAYAVSQAIVDWATEGRISDVGTGSPNKLLYVGDAVDTPPPPPPPACSDPASCEDVTLTIKLDDYPSETSWNIRNSDNVAVASGGGYSGAGSTVTETIALDPGSYTFTIFDSYGDGICCAYGAGWYELRDSYNALLAAGGAFGLQETTPFTVGGGPPLTETVCDDGIDNDGDGYTDCDDSDCAADPACGPPPPTPGCSDPASCEDVTLTIKLDNYPGETSWNIINSSNVVVASGGDYSGAGSTVTATVALDPGNYIFTIFDSYGDGICCLYGSGWYELKDSSSNVLAAGGAFNWEESTPFTISGGGGPPPGETICDDGIDNDGDGLTDCDDSDCADDPVCAPPPACFPAGDSCTVNSDCCSNKCGGPPQNRTCRD
jgi:subtilisin family serine protease